MKLTTEATVGLPRGVTAAEALLLLRLFARLKDRRFGRLSASVTDGRLVDVEVVEKIDRTLLRSLEPEGD